MPTPEEIQSEADLAVSQFSTSLRGQRESSGIRPAPQIEVSEISMDTKKFDINLDRTPDAAESFPDTGGGFPIIIPPTCTPPTSIQVDFSILGGAGSCPAYNCSFTHTWTHSADFPGTSCPSTMNFSIPGPFGCEGCSTSVNNSTFSAIFQAGGTPFYFVQCELDVHCTEPPPCGGTFSCSVNLPDNLAPGVYTNTCASVGFQPNTLTVTVTIT